MTTTRAFKSGNRNVARMARAFELLTTLPDDFMAAGRKDDPPQRRKLQSCSALTKDQSVKAARVGWPNEFLKWTRAPGFPAFDLLRNELLPPAEDPLGSLRSKPLTKKRSWRK